MKCIYTGGVAIFFFLLLADANFCRAQNNVENNSTKSSKKEIKKQFEKEFEREKESEEEKEEDPRAAMLKDYSFMEEYSKRTSDAVFPTERTGFRFYDNNSTAKTQASAFTSITFFGPYRMGARTRAFLTDYSDPNLLFAGANAGGLWRSTNAGQLWTPINDQSTGMNLTCITQSPFDPNIIYYGTGEYKNSKIADDGSGIYKSIDHGLTFTQLASTNSAAYQLMNTIKHSLVDPNTIYAGTTFNGLYRSTDAGATWQSIFNNGKIITDIEVFTTGKVMFTASADGIYYSPTGNPGTFTKATGTPIADFGRIEMAYCDSFPLIMYASISDSVQSYSSGLENAYKSTDGGVTWNTITNPDPIGYWCFADQMMSIVVKPDDPDFVVAAGAQGAYTLNGGQNWIYLNYGRTDHHSFEFSKFNNDVLYVGNDQGLNTFNCGVVPMGPPIDLIRTYSTVEIWGGTYYPTGNNFFFGAQDNCFDKNYNGDTLFARLGGYGSDGKNVHVNQQDPNIAYAAGDFGEMLKTTNALDSVPVFTHIMTGLDTNGDGLVDDDVWHVPLVEMNYLDGNQVYLPTRDHIWRTKNAGALWEPITNSFAGGGNAPCPISVGISNAVQPKVYTAGWKGFFYRIDNAYNAVPGQEVDLSASVPSSLFANSKVNCLTVHPNDDGIVYATVFDPDSVSRVWKIINANTASPQWIDINGNLDRNNNTFWIEVDPDHPDSVLFVGTDYGLYSSVDAGTTWSYESDVPRVAIFQMRLRKSDRKLFVYTWGRGIWIAKLPPSNVGIDSPHTDPDFSIYPNPSHGLYNIYTLNKNIEIQNIMINDMRGRKVKEINFKENNPVQNAVLDLSKEAKGIYYIDIKTNLSNFRKKLIKL